MLWFKCLALVCFLEIFGWFGNHGFGFPLPLTLVLCKDHCLRVDNSWFGTGLLSLLYGCPKYLGGLAMTCLAFLSIWLKCYQQFVSRSSVPLYTSPLYNRPLPGASLASFLSMKPLQFLEVSLSWILEKLWHLVHVPLLCKRVVGKMCNAIRALLYKKLLVSAKCMRPLGRPLFLGNFSSFFL